ncbi:hypothetical protein [Methylobacterium sp. A54F]
MPVYTLLGARREVRDPHDAILYRSSFHADDDAEAVANARALGLRITSDALNVIWMTNAGNRVLWITIDSRTKAQAESGLTPGAATLACRN